MKSIKTNAVLNVIKTSVTIAFSLITYPYAMRVLGVNNIGAVNYVQSVINYFALFAMLGVSSYAIREGAKLRNNESELGLFANEVFTINIISTIISYLGLFLTVLFVDKFFSYRYIFIISCGTILFSTLSVDWINTVFEDYFFITIRSLIIQLLSLVLLVCFVRNKDDYYVYAGLQTLSAGVICFLNFFYCRKYIKIGVTRRPNIKKHLGKLLVLFSNALAVSIYVNFDTTMLGWIKGDYQVGLYSASTKIYSIVKGIMIAIYSVVIPRLSVYRGNNDEEGFRNLYMKLWSYLALVLIPAGIGLAMLSREIIIVVGGISYKDAYLSLIILSFALITIGREKENLLCTILSALINCGLNFIAIPFFGLNGAAFTTLIAEGFVFFFCLCRIPNKSKYFDLSKLKKPLFDSCVSSLVVVLSCVLCGLIIHDIFIRLILSVLISVIFYIIILILIKDEIVIINIKNILKKFKVIK